ncbi:MAG: DEAD/DEAH box helicase [Bacteroidia bacterium]|nr:DEAD/DEAH box helicase [Bacteroidia bacterium]
MKFSQYNIPQELKENLEQLGFRKPTDIQYKSIPHILRGEDLLAISQTGTGKTAAFAIPIIAMLHDRKMKTTRKDGIKCIVMVPTRELALQIYKVFESLAKGTKVRVATIFGGVEQEAQIRDIKKGLDVLITTPGRMFDLEYQGHLLLHRVEILVLDEADHMLELGFIKDIRDVIRKLPKMRQTLFFSATIDNKIKKLAYSLIRSNAIRIQISPKNPVNRNINHAIVHIKMDDKRFFLERLILENEGKKILVFVRTKIRAERVKKALERVGLVSETIHGDKDQLDRFAVMDRFRKGTNKILIATDVSARGIDIPSVDYVVNYDLPEEAEQYVHRVGRTGRGKRKGEAVSFCAPEEEKLLSAIEKYIGMPIDKLEIEYGDYQDTIAFSKDTDFNVMRVIEEAEAKKKNRRKKKN